MSFLKHETLKIELRNEKTIYIIELKLGVPTNQYVFVLHKAKSTATACIIAYHINIAIQSIFVCFGKTPELQL